LSSSFNFIYQTVIVPPEQNIFFFLLFVINNKFVITQGRYTDFLSSHPNKSRYKDILCKVIITKGIITISMEGIKYV